MAGYLVGAHDSVLVNRPGFSRSCRLPGAFRDERERIENVLRQIICFSEFFHTMRPLRYERSMSRGRAVVARKAHNLEVVGSIPTPATRNSKKSQPAKVGTFEFPVGVARIEREAFRRAE